MRRVPEEGDTSELAMTWFNSQVYGDLLQCLSDLFPPNDGFSLMMDIELPRMRGARYQTHSPFHSLLSSMGREKDWYAKTDDGGPRPPRYWRHD